MILDCWKKDPKERPKFSKLVDTISLTLEAVAGYVNFSFSTNVEVKTREGCSGVQSLSEKEGSEHQETTM